jgi:glycerophosphoryl diester phosphodiesterase
MKAIRRKKGRSIIIAILVMIVLCAAASAYIIRIAKNNTISQTGEDVTSEVTEEPPVAEPEVTTETATPPKRLYSYRGSSSDDKYSAAAYDSAIEAGSGCIALPFVVSADGTAYVTDDDYAEEMTGYGGYLSGMKDSQIEELTTKSGDSLLKLSDVFDKYGDSINYVVEIRYTSSRNISALLDAIKENGLEDNVTVSSLYFDALRKVDSEMPDIPTLFLCQDQAGFNSSQNLAYVDIISVDKSIMTKENCDAAHDKDKKFGARTLNTEEEIRAAIEMGADSYFTDETAMAVKIEAE